MSKIITFSILNNEIYSVRIIYELCIQIVIEALSFQSGQIFACDRDQNGADD
jgi:hypothetical protein